MSQELTDNPPGIWGLGEVVSLCAIHLSPRWGSVDRVSPRGTFRFTIPIIGQID